MRFRRFAVHTPSAMRMAICTCSCCDCSLTAYRWLTAHSRAPVIAGPLSGKFARMTWPRSFSVINLTAYEELLKGLLPSGETRRGPGRAHSLNIMRLEYWIIPQGRHDIIRWGEIRDAV